MAKKKHSIDFPVIFVGLKEGEKAPNFAAYQIDPAGRPVKRIGGYNGKTFSIELGEFKLFALGPVAENFKDIPGDNLVVFRIKYLDIWRKQGIVLAQDIWSRFHFNFACVSGTVSKCRPWFWELSDDIRLAPMFKQAQIPRIIPVTAELNPHLIFPLSCQPLCDGVIEIYERQCCCYNIYIPDLIDKLRDILKVLPVPIPDPIPRPDPEPFPAPVPAPIPIPVPGPDPGPYTPRLLRKTAREIVQSRTPIDLSAVPSKNLYEDYLALRTMTDEAARYYVLDRPYLFPVFCSCSVRKVGETNIQPGGHFSFCYLKGYQPPHIGYCYTTYAYKIMQLVDGVTKVVYDGLAAHQYFTAGTPANIKTFNPQAQICSEGTGDPPPNEGKPFVMLEYIGSHGTYHFNFPAQTGVSQTGLLDTDDGSYTTNYAPDCPWGGALGLRLWFSPELESLVKYYRLKVFKVNDSGSPVGTPIVLNNTVSWDKLIEISGDIVRIPETLGPNTVGSENDLFKVPYWSSPDHQYLHGQFHQIWNTAQTKFSDGRYMLVIEVFDGGGNRIKPNGAAGPGTGKNFQFRRWVSSVDTDPVSFADAAHIFYIDNTPAGGDIVDLRQNGIENTAECQFMNGNPADTFSIGFRAYHIHGVDHAGNGDSDSFMKRYDISWQRGLNGPTGSLGFAPSGGNNHTDVGETGPAVSSGSETFTNLLNGKSKCTFSVTLHVSAKHFTGSTRILAYDYWETASFALATS